MEERTCQNCKQDFRIDAEDFAFYKKMQVPPPTFCSGCRAIRRLHFRNDRYLFRRPDAHTGQDIFSGYSPHAQIQTYDNNYWYGSDWDHLATGRDYDFSRPFFEQFKDLFQTAPLPARATQNNLVNSEYCNEAGGLKNCYLCFNIDYGEDSAYIRKARYIKNSLDLYEIGNSELCYESAILEKCYRVFYSLECDNCVDVWFSRNLRGCTNCFGCVNLRNKSYCYFNEQLTKEEYFERIKEFNSGSFSATEAVKNAVQKFWLTLPVRYSQNIRSTNSTGDKIFDSNNIKDSYYVRDSENLAYCQDMWTKTVNALDYTVSWEGAENAYECLTCGMGVSNAKFCFNCWEGVQDMEYSAYCIGCKDCFGCVGLYKNQYCILNKQYTKETYFEMVEKIKKHMVEMPYRDTGGRVYRYGEFFPFELSPVAYNESLAQDFFPITKEEILAKGYIWHDIPWREFAKTLTANELPDDIADTNSEITNEVVECKSCARAFKIIESDFHFYQRMKLPLPRMCHDCRFIERFKFITRPTFWTRSCMKEGCTNTFRTPYAPDRPEIVYCESCYQQEVA